MPVSLSVNYFSVVNVLGYSFVEALNIDVQIFNKNKTIVLTKEFSEIPIAHEL